MGQSNAHVYYSFNNYIGSNNHHHNKLASFKKKKFALAHLKAALYGI